MIRYKFFNLNEKLYVNFFTFIQNKIILLYNKHILNNTTSNSFGFLFVLNWLGVTLPEEAEPIVQFAFSVFSFSMIILFCFINILGYFAALYILKIYKLQDKISAYPRFIKYLKFYEKSTFFWIAIEIIFILICLFLLIIFSLIILRIIVF